MALSEIVERFTQRSPVTVMVRRTLEHALSLQWIDEVFEAQRDKQYTRELLFSSVVDLMGLVALGLRPSLHAAAQSDPDLSVSLAALYDKVNRTEPQVVRALVQGSAQRLLPVVKSAVEASHDLEAANIQVSTYYIATEVKFAYGGMMMVVEPEDWREKETQSAEQLSETLLELAKKVRLSTLRKHPRAAKKKVKKGYVPGKVARKHVATARVLKGP